MTSLRTRSPRPSTTPTLGASSSAPGKRHPRSRPQRQPRRDPRRRYVPHVDFPLAARTVERWLRVPRRLATRVDACTRARSLRGRGPAHHAHRRHDLGQLHGGLVRRHRDGARVQQRSRALRATRHHLPATEPRRRHLSRADQRSLPRTPPSDAGGHRPSRHLARVLVGPLSWGTIASSRARARACGTISRSAAGRSRSA